MMSLLLMNKKKKREDCNSRGESVQMKKMGIDTKIGYHQQKT